MIRTLSTVRSEQVRALFAQGVPVLWANVGWEDVVNIAKALYPKGASSTRLGELAGALDASAAAGVELELTHADPPAMRVLVTVAK